MPAKESRRPAVSEDWVFQQRDWRVQRVGWGVLALLVLAALAGLMGPGPLSSTTARAGAALEVEYERYVRHGRVSELRVSLGAGETRTGQVQIAISRDYLASLDLLRVTPMPVRVLSSGGSLVYVFARASGRHPTRATFVVEPQDYGLHEGEIAVDGDASVAIRQFTYP